MRIVSFNGVTILCLGLGVKVIEQSSSSEESVNLMLKHLLFVTMTYFLALEVDSELESLSKPWCPAVVVNGVSLQ